MPGSIKIKGNVVPVHGHFPVVGQKAPDFTLTNKELKDVKLADFAGKKKILNIVPSLDTSVCSLSAKKFNEKVEKLPDVALLTISADLPFAMTRACTESKVDRVISLSAFRSHDFKRTYGVEIAAGPMAGLTARAVVVLDASDTVIHAELVAELTTEPNYDAAIAAVNPRLYKIGVLGSGVVGQTLAAGLAKHGHTVKIGTRDADKLKEFVAKNPSVGVGKPVEVAGWGELVILASSGESALEVTKGVANEISGKVVLDATNPIDHKAKPVNGVLVFTTGPNQSLMEQLQAAVPAAKFVKAWSSVGNSKMIDPAYESGRRPTMFIAGNDDGAKQTASALLAQVGWNSLDFGKVESARAIEPLAQLWVARGLLFNSWTHAFDIIQN